MPPAHVESAPPAGQPPADPDVALVSRMAAGDESALAELYDRWGGRLYSVALQLLGQPDRAEDVLEDTLWQAWRAASSYSPSRKSVATWLLTIARRKSLERLRARGRSRPPEAETSYGAPDTSFGETGPPSPGAAHAAALERTVRELPDAERAAFELAYFHGMSAAEIAARLDEAGGTVANSLRLATQKVRLAAEPLLAAE